MNIDQIVTNDISRATINCAEGQIYAQNLYGAHGDSPFTPQVTRQPRTEKPLGTLRAAEATRRLFRFLLKTAAAPSVANTRTVTCTPLQIGGRTAIHSISSAMAAPERSCHLW